jgi:hypothetical protein
MLPRAGDAADKMTDAGEIKMALHFAVDHFAHDGGLTLFLGGGTAFEEVALRLGETDGEDAIHFD